MWLCDGSPSSSYHQFLINRNPKLVHYFGILTFQTALLTYYLPNYLPELQKDALIFSTQIAMQLIISNYMQANHSPMHSALEM